MNIKQIDENYEHAKKFIIERFAEKAKDMKLTAMNRDIPISPPTFKKLRTDGEIKAMITIRGICFVLGVTPNQLLGWEPIDERDELQ